jgi:hypothetical protein
MKAAQILARVVGSLALLAVAAFCGFGFLASFEPPNWIGYQIGYASVGCGCIVGIAVLLRRTSVRRLAALGLFACVAFCVLGFVESRLSWGLLWQAGYGAMAGGSLTVAVALWRQDLQQSAVNTINKQS